MATQTELDKFLAAWRRMAATYNDTLPSQSDRAAAIKAKAVRLGGSPNAGVSRY